MSAKPSRKNPISPLGGWISSGRTDSDLLDLLEDQNGELRRHIEQLSPDNFKTRQSVSVPPEPKGMELPSLTFPSGIHTAGLSGITFKVYRGNPQFNDFNTGEIFTPWGSREFLYSSGEVGDLFNKGQYEIEIRVNRPFWVGIGKVLFDTRVELDLSPAWNPSGRWWASGVFGWYGVGVGSTLNSWKLRVTIK